jgi:hypothetical protein
MEKIKNNKINKIYKTEEVNSKLNKFLTTNRAKDLAIDIYRLNLNEIYDKYSINYLKKYHKSEEKIKEFIKEKLKENKIVPDYTGISANTQKTKVKIPGILTKKELKIINKNKIDAFKMHPAERLHRLEEHKMAKWDKKNPKPSFEQLRSDFFPRTIISAYLDLREKAEFKVRNSINKTYYNYKIIVRRYKEKSDEIVEHCIGTIKDKMGILANRSSFYDILVKNSTTTNKKYKSFVQKIIDLRDKFKERYKTNLICLKIMRENKVMLWV